MMPRPRSAPLTVCAALLVCLPIAHAKPPPRCPSEMAVVTIGARTVCIDRFEASLEGKKAVARKGARPAVASQLEARAACAAAGKRLCTVAEWTAACRGPEAKRKFPYGDRYVARRCNDAARAHGKPLPSGTLSECRTPDGIYDLSGNLWEWLADTPPDGETARLVGGSFANPDDDDLLACIPEDPLGQPVGSKNETLGFRCCRD